MHSNLGPAPPKVYRTAVRAAAPAIAIAVVVFLCFMHKAFNIDDVTFLTMARHMLSDPLHPASVELSLNGAPADWISKGMWSGPVMPALLVPTVAAGGAEWIAHLAMLVVFVLGIVASAALAVRLGASATGARWAAILTATSPAVITMSMTCMPDVPTMSFAALGAERLIAYRTQRGLRRAIAASVTLALCMLSRQHGVLILFCLVPVMIATWPTNLRAILTDRILWSTIGVMVAAVAIVVALYHVMSDSHGALSGTPVQVANGTKWRSNLFNLPAQWVLSFPLGVGWIWLYRKRFIRRWWCWLGFALGTLLAWISHTNDHYIVALSWQAPAAGLGLAVLVDIQVDAFRRRDLLEVGLGLWLLIALPAALYAHLPAKYLVPSAPAMAVLLVRHVERHEASWRPFIVMAALCLALSFLMIRADATHGETGRRGGDIVAKYLQRGNRVFYDGGWGFQWYAAEAGALPVTPQSGLRRGDIVVAGQQNWVLRLWPNKIRVEQIRFDSPGGRIMQRPAGFFSNGWGSLPWRWSSRGYPPIDVWEIQ